jgi:hypothetical protein
MPKIKAQIHPCSKKPRIEDVAGILHIYVAEMPVEDKANDAAIKALAKFYNIAKSRITLVGGQKSKQKTFEIK